MKSVTGELSEFGDGGLKELPVGRIADCAAATPPPIPSAIQGGLTGQSVGSIEALLRTAGVEVKNRYARCPLHSDRHPSFRIFTGGDGIERFNCFGCGVRGTAIRLANLLEAQPKSFAFWA